MLPTGLAGYGVGTWAADRSEWSPGDRAMIGVGLGLSMWQATALSFIADQNGWYRDDVQIPGTILSSVSATGIGLGVLAHKLDPDPARMLFMGTAGIWGAWYGAMTPIALDLQSSSAAYMSAILLTSDAAILLGHYATSKKGFLAPRDTLLPQLCGMAGATLGPLGVLMASEEATAVSAGALAGSTAGLVAGSLLQKRRTEEGRASFSLPDIHLGSISASSVGLDARPVQLQDGSRGIYLGLYSRRPVN